MFKNKSTFQMFYEEGNVTSQEYRVHFVYKKTPQGIFIVWKNMSLTTI